MRIAIATDQDFVSRCFGCTPDCTIAEIEGTRICRTFVVPNPGWSHRSWAEFLERNAVACLIVGNIGANARAVLKWRGIPVFSGVQGNLDSVIARYCAGGLDSSEDPGCDLGCGQRPAEGPVPKTS